MSIVLKTPSNGSVTLAEQDTASNVTVTIPARTANVMLDGPAFSAYQSSAQVIPNADFVKLLFQTEEFDTANCYASSRFTPNVAGYYQIIGGVFSGSTGFRTILFLRKNGSDIKRLSDSPSSGNGYMNNGSAIVYLNGTTDYVELFFYQNSGGNLTIPFPQADLVYMQGFMVRGA